MKSKSNLFIGGLALAALMIAALPAAPGIAAGSGERPAFEVDRSAKGNRLALSRSKAVKQAPTETARDMNKTPEPASKPSIMDGCDPMFSPVTVPTMAHIAGRCVG
ncbi:MAG: hypothetical protein WCG92_06095 [Hyphomicrobiales bacterium]|nr:hypothetical protein [Alphaproteobacteria bacterium]